VLTHSRQDPRYNITHDVDTELDANLGGSLDPCLYLLCLAILEPELLDLPQDAICVTDINHEVRVGYLLHCQFSEVVCYKLEVAQHLDYVLDQPVDDLVLLTSCLLQDGVSF
jgi:hypothetical protein